MAIDLTGRTYGDWTVTAYSHRDDKGTHWWRVRCACGTERTQRAWVLTSGKSTRCGACGTRAGALTLRQRQAERWVGTESNGWVILGYSHTVQHWSQKLPMWTCQCTVCGAVVDMSRDVVCKASMPVCRHGVVPPSAENLKEN